MKIKLIAFFTCIFMIFSLPSYGATATKKPVPKKKTISKIVTPPPIVFTYWMPTNPKNPLPFHTTTIKENSIGTPVLYLFAVNVSKKPITAFEFTCSFLDGFEEPVYRMGSKNSIFKGIVNKTYLLPNSKVISSDNGQLYSFNLAVYELTQEIKGGSHGITVTRVKFKDGTAWTRK